MTSCIPDLVYGTAWKKEETARLVELAVQTGFRGIDTANQPKHYNEPGVGLALKNLAASGISRDQIFLQTKFTPIDGHDHRVPYNPEDRVQAQVRQSFASSLEHLQTDWLDSYLLHGPYGRDGLNPNDWEVWKELENIFSTKIVRRIGISNVSAKQLCELVAGAAIKPMIVQNRCYASRGWDSEVRNICRDHQIIYQGFSLLTANLAAIEHPEVLALAKKHSIQPAQLIFRFAQQIGMQPLTGTTSVAHMQLDLESRMAQLSEDELAVIERLTSSQQQADR